MSSNSNNIRNWINFNSQRANNINNNVPESLRSLGINRLDRKYLNLSNQNITELTPDIGLLTNLRYVNLVNNKLTSLPDSIGNLENLRHLNLHINKLTSLPESIGNLKNLKNLNLCNNKLSFLPLTMSKLKNLLVLDVRCNRNLKYIDMRLKRKGLTVYRLANTKFIDYISYFKNQISVITVKRPNLPYLPKNIRKKILNMVTKPPTHNNTNNNNNINKSIIRGKNIVNFVEPPTKKQKAGNSAQGRRTNINNSTKRGKYNR